MIDHDNWLQRVNACALTPSTPQSEKKGPKAKRTKLDTKFDIPVHQYHQNINVNDNGSLIQVKIVYEPTETWTKGDHNRETDCKTEVEVSNYGHDRNIEKTEANVTSNQSLIKGQTLLTSFFRPIKRKSPVVVDDIDDSVEFSIDIEQPENIVISDHEETSTHKNHLLWHRKLIRRKYSRVDVCRHLIRKKIQTFLVQLVLKSRKQFPAHWRRFKHNKNVSFVYRCLISYNEFTRAFVKQNNPEVETKQIDMTTEALVINRRVQKLLNENNANMRETNEENPTPAHNPSDTAAKRPPKNQRTSDNARQLLLTENPQESSEKDFREWLLN